jgi:starvation-inducible outer membrane lipoprotein
VALAGSGCSGPAFPEQTLKRFDPDKQFSIFDTEADIYLKGVTVKIGGRLLDSTSLSGGIQILAQELPLSDHSSNRPIDTVPGVGRFIVFYPATVDPRGLQPGNKFVLLGTFERTERLNDHGVNRILPYLRAQCLFMWKTGTYALADYPYLPDGYSALETETYCVSQ